MTSKAVAYHEAGHVVMAHVRRVPVRRVTIRRSQLHLGLARLHPIRALRQFNEAIGPTLAQERHIRSAIEITLAGPIAERHVTGRRNRVGASGDYRQVMEMALHLTQGDADEASLVLKWLEHRTTRAITSTMHWAGVESLATALLARETLTGQEARGAIIAGFRSAMEKYQAQRRQHS